MNFRNTATKNLIPYIPGEQPETSDWVKLNTNEFPYQPSPNVQKQLELISKSYIDLRKYSHPYAEPLRSLIAKNYDINPNEVIVTNGSDEVLSLICRCFLDKNETIAFPEVTYTLYETLAIGVGAVCIKVPMIQNIDNPFTIDIEALEKTNAKIIFLPNPNALTGEYIEVNILKKIIQTSKKLWIIDEAYIGFVENITNPSYLNHLSNEKNVIVTRTLSKSHGLAGMRIGYAISKNQDIMNALYAMKDSYNQDSIAIQLGVAALLDVEYYNQKKIDIINERNKLNQELKLLDFFSIPSQANFILTKPKTNIKAEEIYLLLKNYKILVRFFKQSLISDYIRITIGTSEENRKLIEVLKQYET